MESIERGILIQLLEIVQHSEKKRLEDATSLLAIVSAFRSLGPDYEAIYTTQRNRVSTPPPTQPMPDTPAILQTLIDRLRTPIPGEMN
jgi:hypothetical protein